MLVVVPLRNVRGSSRSWFFATCTHTTHFVQHTLSTRVPQRVRGHLLLLVLDEDLLFAHRHP